MIYYVAADRNGEVFLYEDEPILGNGYWQPSRHRWYKVSPSLFPNVTFVNSPMKVEIKLIEE